MNTTDLLQDTYVAALQHGLVDLAEEATLVGVVRRPTGWFRSAVDKVIAPDADGDDRQRAMESVERTAATIEDYDAVEARLVEDEDIVDTIVAATEDHDHTVIGATRECLLQQVVFDAIPEEVGRRAEHTVIMAKRYRGLTSRVARWFRRRGANR